MNSTKDTTGKAAIELTQIDNETGLASSSSLDAKSGALIAATNISPAPDLISSTEHPLIIVGNGPVGLHLYNELQRNSYRGVIKIFGDEAALPYNRVQLSLLLSGEKKLHEIQSGAMEDQHAHNFHFHNCAVVAIDRESRFVTDANGHNHHYSSLILAMGSSAHIPNVGNTDLKGVYTFRDIKDAEHLVARRVTSRHTVVVGGGLLGIEAARAMQRLNTKVTIIQQGSRLMNRQLDDEAADLLKSRLEKMGMTIVVNNGLQSINTNQFNQNVLGSVSLRSGKKIACDTLILATGISPNVDIARKAWIKVNRGIVVDNQLQTNDENVFAIGECAEHKEQVYGLVAPGLEQASVLATTLSGKLASYQGSIVAPKLKVAGIDVFSMGDVGDAYDAQAKQGVHRYTGAAHNGATQGGEGETQYRSIVVAKRKIVGAVGVGSWHESRRLQDAISNGQTIYPWHYLRFKRKGYLWSNEADLNVSSWPPSAVVCNCKSITRGELSIAIAQGCTSVENLAQCTGASTVCGSCKPLLANLSSDDSPTDTADNKNFYVLLSLSAVSLVLAIVFSYMSPIPYLQSVINTTIIPSFDYDRLWRDTFFKQVSGYTLLTLSCFAMLISLRKRIPKISLWTFPSWRIIHTAIGIALIIMLIGHTGARLGENLNFYLMVNFLLIIAIGAFTGAFAAFESKMAGSMMMRTFKQVMNSSHIYLLWPLPVLLGFHIVSVYFY